MEIRVNTDKLDKLGKGLDVGVVLRKLALDCEADVKQSFNRQSPAPVGEPPGVDTGNLKNSIVAVKRGKNWAVLVGAPYGVHLEYGTRRMGARPFLLPAVRRVARRVTAEDLVEVLE